MVWFNISGAK